MVASGGWPQGPQGGPNLYLDLGLDLDLSWLPTSGWSSKGSVPRPPVSDGAKVAADKGWEFRWGFDDPEALKRAGTILAVGGGLMSAIGAYSQASTAKYQSTSAALAFEFESQLSGQSAMYAEHEAQSILAASKMDIGRLTLEYGQQRAARRAATAASGVRLDRGSSARVAASEALRARVDEQTIRENAVRGAGAARVEAARLRGQSLLNEVSARNARRMARLYNPYLAAATSIMNTFGSFGAQMASDRNRSGR